jgi:ribulose kinase
MTPKALWLLENEPEVYEQAHRVLETTDWFVFQLTGEWTASLCNTTCKWNYASPDGGWSVEFLDAVGLSGVLEKWPSRVLPMGAEAGRLLPEPANELGLVPGIPVAEGGIDAHVGMVGLGVTEPGSAAVILGSSVVHLALSESPVFDPGIWGPYPDAVIPGLWLVEGGQVSAGSILAWFKDNFAADIVAEARTAAVSPYSLLDRLAESTPPGAEGLIVLDHFQGNRTPLRDPFSRGAVWGLTLSHSKGHLVRAVYESLAFGTRHIFDTWSRAGFSVDHVCVSGGGTRSRVWLQTLAAVCKSPIHVPRDSQAGCLGCAICAAVAAGEYGSITEAAREMVHVASTVEPDPAAFEDYDFYYDKYLRTYEALRALMHEVANKQMSGRTE